jgi:hypothetical protein
MEGASEAVLDIFGPGIVSCLPTAIAVSECVLGLSVTLEAIFILDGASELNAPDGGST